MIGRGSLRVIIGFPEELEAAAVREFGRPLFVRVDSDLRGWVLKAGGGGIGLLAREDMPWEDYVVDVAEVIQESVIESLTNWGAAFPPCPEHPNHPMDPKVVAGVASWVCPRGTVDPIAIGTLGLTER